MKSLLFLLLSLVTLRVEAVCVSYSQAMANNGSCTESKPDCCTLFPHSAGRFDDGAGGCDCCCSSCADNEAVCAQDVPQDFCNPGDCCYTTTMDITYADVAPQVGDVVKFFNESQGPDGTSYTATIMSIEDADDGTMKYQIEYVDESTHAVQRYTILDTLSAMPIQINNTKFCECHLDDACADAVCTTGPPSAFSCAPTSPCDTLFPNSPQGCMVGQACSSEASCGSSLDPYCFYSCLDAPADTVSTTGKTCQLACQAGEPDHGGGVSCPTGCVPKRLSRARRLLFGSLPHECGPGCEPM